MIERGEGGTPKLSDRHTCFPFRERYMTSGFVLNEFNLDLPTPGLLLRFGFFDFVVIIIYARVYCVVIIDERVVGYGLLTWLSRALL